MRYASEAVEKMITSKVRKIKAKVTTQSISCTTGCPVTETAVFTTKLWG